MASLRRLLAVALAVLFSTAIAAAQSKDVKDLRVGKLLVSARNLPDPNFADSVVLLIQYDAQGALGLMINRRTQATISRVLQDLSVAKSKSDPVYLGGPVELDAVFGLSRSKKKIDGATSILDEVYLVSSKPVLEKTLAASAGPGDFRLYLGYCGWAGGQLETEVDHGGWWILDADPKLVFDPDPASVWSRLIARTEREFAMTAPARESRH